MQIKSFILLVALNILFVTIGSAQPRNYEIKNGFYIGGGVTQFDIISDNFETNQGSGILVSMGIGADLPHKWYNISYNIQLAENKFELSGRMSDDVTGNEAIEYKVFTAQLGLIMHVKLIGAYLTLDLGPQLQYNGDLELTDNVQESYFINNYESLQASDIKEITNFNVNALGGVTASFGAFKLRGQYIYGITNMLNKLNDQDLNSGNNSEIKGNQGMLTLAAFIVF